MLKIMVIVALIFNSVAAAAKNTIPLKLNKTVTGTAGAASGTILRMDGRLIRLLTLQDMNDSVERCYQRGRSKVPPSRFAAQSIHKSTCKQEVKGPKRAACKLTFTAVEQREKLAELVAGKSVTCKYPDDSQLTADWARKGGRENPAVGGYPVTRGGAKVYPGACFIDGKSIGVTFIEQGFTALRNSPNRRYSDALFGDKFHAYHRSIEDKNIIAPYTKSSCPSLNHFNDPSVQAYAKDWFFDPPK